jgi:hypothetical protein
MATKLMLLIFLLIKVDIHDSTRAKLARVPVEKLICARMKSDHATTVLQHIAYNSAMYLVV